jgi:beta-lactam-binding protein with PASTA domain
MSDPGHNPRRPVARRRVRPIWLLLAAVLALVACGCSGLLLHAVTTGGSGGGGNVGSDGSPSGPAGTTTRPAPATGDRRVPNVVGVALPDARRRLKAAGYSRIHVEDVTGKRRIVLDQKNWVVRIQEPAVGAMAAGSTRITLRVGKPSDLATTAAPISGVVPDVVCRDLQTAQDALQAAGFYVLSSRDGTGKDRHQILDRNWIVIAQSAGAGSRPRLSTRITLTVLKFGEPTTRCPR